MARKIRALKRLSQEKAMDDAQFKIMKKKNSTMKMLRTVYTNLIEKSQQVDTSKLNKAVEEMLNRQAIPAIRDLEVPEHLLCQISGDLMTEPVLIESGQTYEKEVILRYIEI